MTKATLLLVVLALAAAALGQQASSPFPRPMIYGGLDLGDSAAYVVGAGITENTKHFLFAGEASHDNDGKSNDNDNRTRNGYDNRFKASAYFRWGSGFFLGGGARWAKLTTFAYSKEQWHPTIGIGSDFIGPFASGRLQMDYVTPWGAEHTSASGCAVPKGQCGSGIQGPEFSLYMPSPAVRGHVFARITIAAYAGHTTITSTDPVLTAAQVKRRVWLAETQITLGCRF